ncbi:zinc-binding protein A33-like isoform X2 [Narcine bancroftii]|uniref:zinc-binding protein A33-like isoform X2 n=1 Tax=Narcine bancroftii TaxID=1343680 RepID=UPI0038313C9C
MAAGSSLSLGDELNCPICLDLFVDPVMLDCGHDFCRQCIVRSWEREGRASCPECGQLSPDKSLKANRALGVLAGKIRALQPRAAEDSGSKPLSPFCDEHLEELKLFCDTDKKLLCVMCLDRRDGRSHRGHNFMLMGEAVEIHREKMRANLQSLNQKKTSVQNVLLKQQQSISEIQEQSNNLQKHITSEFAKLRTVLDEKESLLVKELADQEGDILKKMETNLQDIQEHLKETEEKLSNVQAQLSQQDAFIILKEDPDKGKSDSNFQTIVAEGKLPLGSFKGPIQYRVWRDIMEVIHPAPASLTLDPSTAHPSLVLIDDHTGVKLGDKFHPNFESLEASDHDLSVLAAVGFSSGRHYWEVNVGNKTAWDLGVVKDIIRKQGSRPGQDPEYWVLTLKNGGEYWLSTAPPTHISVSLKPKKIGVYLDYEGGQLTFYNVSNMSTLFTFSRNFSGKLFPYFSPGNNEDKKNSEPLVLVHFKNR